VPYINNDLLFAIVLEKIALYAQTPHLPPIYIFLLGQTPTYLKEGGTNPMETGPNNAEHFEFSFDLANLFPSVNEGSRLILGIRAVKGETVGGGGCLLGA
jgi:hypothetical protein